ncbi:DUF3017 domain-containing protein [Brachybacterium halotolerans subsp. kimchii]|uniref:DUF3017 domain-containing protein n=1 Tax=Brachybacterium halotolerans TaxID=2795215 RepID=A0ABS1B9C8_9MICO|nr:DUF3017 domain-containing protein [Brachybacterium halotolerans]MBK0331258.1 DUF3017 domain-containing protein [Brachybacterium halotolerans]UEJ82279.1 DUF3017 domain-containing protein [Brachybacterium halotolerans subsp. kimchii]
MSPSTSPGPGVGPDAGADAGREAHADAGHAAGHEAHADAAGPAQSAPRRVPLGEGLRRQTLLLLALIALVAVLGFGASTSAVVAGRLLAALLLVVALLRACLPASLLGALVVRSRGLDVLVMLALAGGLAVLSAAPNL